MPELMRFAESHPWWTLVYLVVIASGIAGARRG